MEIDEKEQCAEGWNIIITLECKELKETSDYWKDQCSILYNMIQTELPSGSIKPLSHKASKGEKAELIMILNTLVVTGIAAKAIDKLADIIRIWQQNRPKAKITLKYPDGSSIEFSNLSIQEAKKTMKEQQKQSSTLKSNYD